MQTHSKIQAHKTTFVVNGEMVTVLRSDQPELTLPIADLLGFASVCPVPQAKGPGKREVACQVMRVLRVWAILSVLYWAAFMLLGRPMKDLLPAIYLTYLGLAFGAEWPQLMGRARHSGGYYTKCNHDAVYRAALVKGDHSGH